MKKLLLAGVILAAFAACGGDTTEPIVETEPPVVYTEPTDEVPTEVYDPTKDDPTEEMINDFDFGLDLLPPEYTFGNDIVLGSFVLTFDDNIQWTTVTDEASQHYGAEVFRIPVSVMNISHITHNPNTIDFYSLVGPTGMIDNLSQYFMDYDMAGVGGIAMGATTNAYIHFLYQGSGLYYMLFDFGDWEMPVRFPISR